VKTAADIEQGKATAKASLINAYTGARAQRAHVSSERGVGVPELPRASQLAVTAARETPDADQHGGGRGREHRGEWQRHEQFEQRAPAAGHRHRAAVLTRSRRAAGAAKARVKAGAVLARARRACGLDRSPPAKPAGKRS
jgi:hypothetical protein